MNVTKVSNDKGSSCNFCQRDREEKLDTYEISRICNGGLAARICIKCIGVLNVKISTGDV